MVYSNLTFWRDKRDEKIILYFDHSPLPLKKKKKKKYLFFRQIIFNMQQKYIINDVLCDSITHLTTNSPIIPNIIIKSLFITPNFKHTTTFLLLAMASPESRSKTNTNKQSGPTSSHRSLFLKFFSN